MKNTKSREAIISIFRNNPNVFFSAKDIHQKLEDTDLVTVYRNLELFASEGTLKPQRIPNEKEQYYEYSDTKDHHHIVCSSCDKVVHVDLPEDVLRSIKGISHFKKGSISILVSGHCK